MTLFVLGLIIFYAPHLFSAVARNGRAAMIGRLGEAGYKGIYSAVSAVGFALIIIGWRNADTSVLYVAPYWVVYAAYALTALAFIFLAAAYLPKGRLAAAVKHPMLAGVKLWAFGHLIANGDVRSVLLFGSLLAFAAFDRIAVARRDEPAPRSGPPTNDLIAVCVGATVWAAIYFFLHPYVAGVALH